MGKGGSNTSTSTTTNSNPAYTQAYLATLGRANDVSNTPYQAYTGEGVANYNASQQQAQNEVTNAQGAAQPYINSANNYYTQGAAPSQIQRVNGQALGNLETGGVGLSNAATQTFGNVPKYDPGQAFNPNQIQQYNAGSINQYMSPYTQQVVDATQKQMNQQNATGVRWCVGR